MFSFGFNFTSLFSSYSYSSLFSHHSCYSYSSGCGRHSDASASSILAGTTNTDGTGSSVNLTLDNASLSLLGNGSVTQDGVTLTHTTHGAYSETWVSVSEWNQDGYKEVKINNADDALSIRGVVDVDITNSSSTGVSIDIASAKRGQIETGCGDDDINITVYSNNNDWVNDFVINTGAGDDSLTMADAQNSSFTSLEIDMGRGNDSVDVAGLSLPSSDAVSREIDGGRGFDSITLSSTSAVEFSNFEWVQGEGDVELALSADLLADNDAYRGLVFSDVELTFADDVHSVSFESLSWCDVRYLDSLGLDSSDYIALDVCTADGSYEVLTNDTNGFCYRLGLLACRSSGSESGT